MHAVRGLKKNNLPSDAKILEVGTSILDVLPDLEHAERVIILDAMNGEGEPGTVYRIPLDQCEDSLCIASMHGFDFLQVLKLTKRHDSPDVLVFGVEPAQIGWSMELSREVSAALPFLLEAVRGEIMGN